MKKKFNFFRASTNELLMSDGTIRSDRDFTPSVKCYIRPVLDMSKSVDKTQQGFRDECDINTILRKMAKGVLPVERSVSYGDFASAPSFEQALTLINVAKDQFSSLSADTRARFNNDPARFLAFVNDPSNNEEMIKLGLASRHQDPLPDPVLTELQTLNKNLTPKVKKESSDSV